MSVKVYEGTNLDSLIERAKQELGENVKILYYEVEKKPSFIPFVRKKFYRLFVTEKKESESKQKDEELKKLESELSEVKEMLISLKEEMMRLPPPALETQETDSLNPQLTFKEFTGDALELISLLVKKGVEPDVAAEIVKASCGLDIETEKLDLNTATFREALINSFQKLLSFSGEFKVKKGEKRIFAFLGPTGVGKTTNLFKLASKFVIEQELKVGVITTDAFKVGGAQQARIYASILNVPFFLVTDPKKLKETINNLSDLDVILIDTVGRSHYDYFRLGEIKAMLSSVSSIENVLLISCNYDHREALEVVNRYRSYFPIHYLFFTKIDEALRPGNIINVSFKTGFPMCYVSTGQRVPEDIKLLSPELLTEYVLDK